MAGELYEFGEFTLDASERRLTRGGQVVFLEPKAHDVLLALVRKAGRLVTKRELLELVWPESFVEEGILAVHISGLRKALGDDAIQIGAHAFDRGGATHPSRDVGREGLEEAHVLFVELVDAEL